MARPDPRAVVAMKILIEQDVVAPVRIALEGGGLAEDGTVALRIAQEDAGQPVTDLFGDLPERHLLARPGGALDGERVAKVVVEGDQPADQQDVDRHPDRPAPVRVAPEESCARLRWLIVYAVFTAAKRDDIGMLQVFARERADPVGTQELRLVEHAREQQAQ